MFPTLNPRLEHPGRQEGPRLPPIAPTNDGPARPGRVMTTAPPQRPAAQGAPQPGSAVRLPCASPFLTGRVGLMMRSAGGCVRVLGGLMHCALEPGAQKLSTSGGGDVSHSVRIGTVIRSLSLLSTPSCCVRQPRWIARRDPNISQALAPLSLQVPCLCLECST